MSQQARFIAAALDQRGEQFDYKAGMLPLGYQRIISEGSERIVLDQARAKIARLILDLKQQQGYTLRDIADELNRLHIPARRGGIWHHSAVAAVLKHSDVYAGNYPSYPALR